MAVLDLSPGVQWSDGLEYGTCEFSLDSANAWQILRDAPMMQDFDRAPGTSFTTYLPARTCAGVARRVSERLNFALLLDPSWDLDPARLRAWQTTVTAEAWVARWLPLGCAVSWRTGRGITVGIDLAALLGRFACRAGFEDVAGLLLGAKGASVRLSIGYGTTHREWAAPPQDVFRLRHGVN
jgi:hypothetical protein